MIKRTIHQEDMIVINIYRPNVQAPKYIKQLFSSVQFSRSVVSNSLWPPWTAARQASLSITNFRSPSMSIESVMPSNHLILCCPLLLLPSILPSIRVFSNESALCIRWPKYWSFSFSISSTNEHPGLISFRMDRLNLLEVQAIIQFSSVQSLSHIRLFVTPWIAAHQASLSITNSRSSPRLTSIESVMPSSHFILCRPLLLLPLIPPWNRVFSNESALRMRWPKYWSFSLSIILSKEHPGLISFRMDWLDLLAVQGTLKGLLQHHSSKTSILQHSAFFTIQLSHPNMTTGKTIVWLYGPLSAKLCLCL